MARQDTRARRNNPKHLERLAVIKKFISDSKKKETYDFMSQYDDLEE